MKAINLKVEYLTNPIGIDITKPRFFWNCEQGTMQSAYQIISVNDKNQVMWDSGKVASNAMTHISYEGALLQSRNRIFWKVKLWDEQDIEGAWSEEASFEMGLLKKEDWMAKWITGDYLVDKKKRYPVDCFKKFFTIELAQVEKARAYLTACGVYEGSLNGKKMGSCVMAPGITDYRKRIQYQTIDITNQIKDGENELNFLLADGWYRGSVGAWAMKNYYGFETKLLAQIELTMKDGSIRRIVSDESFSWSNDGPICFADNKDGEIFDGTKTPSYQDKAKYAKEPVKVTPTAANNVAVTEHERLKPKLLTTPLGKQVLDFKQNIAGYIEFSVLAKKGQRIFLRFGEMLDKEGEFTQKNIQCVNKKLTTPLQQVEYICKEGENHYKTRFALFGFQYALIETDVDFKPEDFTAIAVYSNMETTFSFDSSNELLNKFVENTLWSEKNNSADLPTDCPTRERHGWTGDAQIFFTTAAYMTNYATFAKKFVRDMTDWQRADGCFPQIAPEGGTDPYMRTMNGSVGWADAGVLIPYRFWKIYGDESIIRENYDAMCRYARFMINRCGEKSILAPKAKIKKEYQKYLVNTGQAYGEWAEPSDVHKMTWKDCAVPHPEVSTAYTSYVMSVMAEIASKLGHTEDEKQFAEYAKGTRMAYQELIKLPEYSIDTDRQAKLVRPLYFDLFDKEQEQFAKKRLVAAMENYKWRVGTGFLSTPLILDVLESIDLSYAYKLLENEELPGWLCMPKAGASTIWEDWDGPASDNGKGGGIASLNHYSKGACLEWVFKSMCGIQIDGTNHFRIAPKPGGHFTFANFTYKSVYGEVTSAWKKNPDGTISYDVTVPANTSAEFCYPDGTLKILQAGVYQL